MLDSFNRNIDYMRVSITDRCNLQCGYCMPNGFKHASHDDILRYEDLLRLCGIIADTGVKIIRVTGGEPLVRKGCVDFIRQLKATDGIELVTMTTNGLLLEPYIPALVDSKLDGLNISLDTLDADTYRRITGKDELHAVLTGLDKALDVGLNIKLNCVLMAGINEKDVLPMARLAESMPIDIRFIELMPTDLGKKFHGINGDEVLCVLQGEYPDIEPDFSIRGWGPAKYYKSARLVGKIGFINAMSDHICSKCNRLRLTSQGFLRLCLYSDDGIGLREMLHSGADDASIKNAVINAIYSKPREHTIVSTNALIECMSNIGG